MSLAKSALVRYSSFTRLVANHPKALIATFLGSWLIGAAVFGLIEGIPLMDSLYWSSTTLTTVGYGDISPATNLGMAFTILFQFWAILFIVPVVITTVIEVCKIDKDKDTNDEQEWREDMLIFIAEKAGGKRGVDFPEPPADY